MSRQKNLALTLLGAGALASPALADLTVTGRALYVDRVFTFTGGFTNNEPELPVRFARVVVANDDTGAILANSNTDENGDFTIAVTGSGTLNLRVTVQARTTQFGSSVRVTDGSNSLYTMSAPTFVNWDLDTDLDAGTIVSEKLTAAGRVGNPFNLLDQIVDSMQWIQSVGGANLNQPVRATWPGGSGSFATGANFFMSDDDGYDDLVQLHEFGHVVHNIYSDSDSPGGSHSFGQSDQDPRLSFGEGFATAFAGAVRNFTGVNDPGFYIDCSGTGATGAGTIQLRMRMENGSPFTNTTLGEADEGAVFCALWDLIDTEATNDNSVGTDDDPLDGSFQFLGGFDGDELLWRSLDGPVQFASNLTQRDMWNGLFSPGDPGFGNELASIFENWGQRFVLDDDEPNNSFGTAIPLASFGTWSGTRTLYSPASGTFAPGEGDSDYYSVDLSAGLPYEFETRYPGGLNDAGTFADPALRLWRPDGTLFAIDDDSGTGRNALIDNVTADQTGSWRIEVFTDHPYRRTGSYQLRARTGPTDCNDNGVDDATDIQNGTSSDFNTDGIPDECQPLFADGPFATLFGLTPQVLTLDAGPVHAGKFYLMVGSATGTTPGTPFAGLMLPIVVDDYTSFVLANPNGPPLSNSFGVLNGQGQATAEFQAPPGVSLMLLGTQFHHAYLVFNAALEFDLASNSMPVTCLLYTSPSPRDS